jgi:hypothetical protein
MGAGCVTRSRASIILSSITAIAPRWTPVDNHSLVSMLLEFRRTDGTTVYRFRRDGTNKG